MTALKLTQLLKGSPAEQEIPAAQVRKALDEATHRPILVVLDDDPTGTQSVADLPVLTTWQQEDFAWALTQGAPAVYVMTNSRSLDPADAQAVNREVSQAALAAARELNMEISFVSRSDSTLRGHFPLEPDTLAEELSAIGQAIDGYVIVPAFGDAGRITVDGVHYAGNETTGFVPVAETEFAADATFGYQNSHLAQWVEEKTGGTVPAHHVIHLDLSLIRSTPEAIAAKLMTARDRQPIVVDIVSENDLRMLTLGLIQAENEGKRFIYRVGPPFCRARIGQDIRQPLSSAEIEEVLPKEVSSGGLIVVGSHVPTTTRQLNALVEAHKAEVVELDVRKIVGQCAQEYLSGLVDEIADMLTQRNVVIHTSRELVTGASKEESLAIAREVSAALVTVVNQLIHRLTPRFVIAKGGITSSDTASKGLEMRRAMVVGPMEPGIISMWKAADGPAVGVPYIVFAGNVGSDQSLVNVVTKLSERDK